MRRLAVLVATLWAVGAAPSGAAVTPDAEAALRAACARMQAATSLAVRVETRVTMRVGAMTNDMTLTSDILLARPNRFRIDAAGGPLRMLIASDGTTVQAHVPGGEGYLRLPAPASLAETRRDEVGLLLSIASAGAPDTLPFLAAADPYAFFVEDTLAIDVAGVETNAGVALTRLRVKGEEMDMEVWVRGAPDAAIVRIVPDTAPYVREMRSQVPAETSVSMDVQTQYGAWAFGAHGAEAFALAAPEGAERVESFGELMGDEEDAEPAGAALVGKPAPMFTLDRLGGGSFALAGETGKGGVLILDFWATWCGPCVLALPELIGLADEMADRGVRLVGVNQREDARTIQRFLESRNLKLDVVLDTKGEAASLYGVTGIPQTVLIGPDGNVADVHVGYSPSLRQDLRAKIETLLAEPAP